MTGQLTNNGGHGNEVARGAVDQVDGDRAIGASPGEREGLAGGNVVVGVGERNLGLSNGGQDGHNGSGSELHLEDGLALKKDWAGKMLKARGQPRCEGRNETR